MADVVLGESLQDERGEAVRALLAQPLRHVGDDLDTFRLVARHHEWLTAWFDETCGWALSIDIASGVVRLAKLRPDPDATRPLTTGRGQDAPFDRRRYQFLCLIAAELVTRPMTTMGLLAQAVASRGEFRTERHGDRRAFVDALRALVRWHAVTVTSGDVDSFVTEESANALLAADSTVLHRLLVSPVAPSRLTSDDVSEAVAALTSTHQAPDESFDRDERNRRCRQGLARRLLDDPVVHLDDCSEDERSYLATGAGRQWLRDRTTEAGLELEERAEGLLAVDEAATTSDVAFPAPHGNVHQMALLLVESLVEVDSTTGQRLAVTRSSDELVRAVRVRLDTHPRWAKAFQDPGGERLLASQALDLLASIGLVRPLADHRWEGRPAICRYRVETGGML